MEIPIALIIFNRAKQTKRIIDALRPIQPKTLYVVADGPRTPAEKALCNEARAMIDTIDWPCDVKKKYSETNLGCGVNESKGLDWMFSEVERGIVLEDDCLPHPTFFKYCEELLEKYKDDARVMNISGNFFHQKNKNFRSDTSYYFSSIPHVWGWATWRRAWDKYDYELTRWPEFKKTKALVSWFQDPATYEYWASVWDQYYDEKVNNYDARWVFACAAHNGASINPCVNLITNIGFDELATHTKVPDASADIPTEAISFPLRHPSDIYIDFAADTYTMQKNFGVDEKLFYRLVRPIKTHFPGFYRTLKDILLPFLRR